MNLNTSKKAVMVIHCCIWFEQKVSWGGGGVLSIFKHLHLNDYADFDRKILRIKPLLFEIFVIPELLKEKAGIVCNYWVVCPAVTKYVWFGLIHYSAFSAAKAM